MVLCNILCTNNSKQQVKYINKNTVEKKHNNGYRKFKVVWGEHKHTV